MSGPIYKSGSYAALTKLGLQLSFDSPEEAQRHRGRRDTLGKVTGAVGNVGGGILGGTLGSAGGPAGTIAGSVAGSVAGQKALSGAGTLAYDVAHDVPQKAKSQYRSSVARMNAGAGMPSGIGKVPSGYPQQMGQIQQTA